eukprot:gnl/TRDRNA2_/TRDRNA2_171906_c0_seq6.p1 gnl/TRDRNA2_/TRDRNA2_171906_c0~~gnl/TRDRNA2_/TRDRNA2_171906_c0_seq6.p1  ORF type:complete len:167 (-),score=28.89 gnl/TRDRNA2_/TRDRNA2_171906_c0_seq6:36-536(-)
MMNTVERRAVFFNLKELTSAARTFSKMGRSTVPLFMALASAAECLMDQSSVLNLACLAKEFAVAGHSNIPCFEKITRAVQCQLDDLNLLAVADMAWALEAAGQSNSPLFAAVASKAEQLVGDFSRQELNYAWALVAAAAKTSNGDVVYRIPCPSLLQESQRKVREE